MNRSLVSSLRCIKCGNALRLDDVATGSATVETGVMACACGTMFPVTGGIARLLPTAEKSQRGTVGSSEESLRAFVAQWERTQRSFGRQWNRYEVQSPTEDVATFEAKTGFARESLRGLRVLDAGCGGGRYSYVAGQADAEVFSVDISSAVEKAANLCQPFPNVQVLQANLLALPFPPAMFDRIFSIGVLHHTPDTRQAFMALVPLLKPGGKISIWLYPKWDRLRETMNSFWRGITTRLPHGCVHAISVAASPLGGLRGRVYSKGPRWLARVLWQTDKLLPGISNHPDPRQRVCDTFDWLTPQYQWHHTDDEVRAWFQEAGLTEVVNLSETQKLFHHGQGEGICFTGKLPLA